MTDQQAATPEQEPEQVVYAPQWADKCPCGAPSTHTLVLHFWPVDRPPLTRGIHNSVRMFPGIVACEEHARAMAFTGERMLNKVFQHVRELFTKLSLSDPDLKDCLIDVRTFDEAAKMWSEPPGHTTLIVH